MTGPLPATLSAALGDRYRLERELGAGGMATVYLAEDSKHHRQVAIKVMRPEVAAALGAERFLREIETTANLRHPHILPLYDSGEAGGFLYYVMPYVVGESLRDRLSRETQLPLADALQIACEVAEALHHAHRQGVVHRDIKPENILLEAGHAVVADFGIARAMTEAGGERLTRTGLSLGTPLYMSPEQGSGDAVDARSDLYSLGCVVYETLAGTPPFAGPTAMALLARHALDPVPPLASARPGVPGHVAEAVVRALAKTPADRFFTVEDFARALRDGRGPTVGPSGPTLGNLPASVDSFVARESEVAEVTAALAGARLVTLTGVGGTGKSRLAVEVATRLSAGFTDGAWLAELAPVIHADAVPYVVADLVGAVQQQGKTIAGSVVDALRHRSLLLVLDNCEHLLDAAAELATAITTQCAGVRILATSRESLAIRGEHVIRLQSLSDEDGARLFRDRAVAAGARGELDTETLARLSRRLDGMPLAIELAAARCGSMTPEVIERRLDDRFRLLRGSRRGRMERHQTLRNTVTWSYELLNELEQRVFNRLSAFAGGFTVEAAQVVAGGEEIDPLDVEDAVLSLVARSMVLASDTEDDTRYRLLETLRQFGEEQLVKSGDVERTRARHLAFFTAFMDRAWTGLWSADDARWIRAVGQEFENLRVAVHAAIDGQDREALAMLLKPHQWWAWHALRYEVGDWAEAALAVRPEPEFARAVAVHLRFHGGRADEVLRLAKELGAPDAGDEPDATCLTAWGRWNAALVTGSADMTTWMSRTIEAAGRTGNPARAAALASIEVAFRLVAGEAEAARRVASRTYHEAKASDNQTALCWTSFFLGRAWSETDPTLALQYFDRAIEIAERIRNPLVSGLAATEAAVVIARSEEPSRGRVRLSRALRSFVNSGDRQQLWTSAHHLAYFLVRAGRPDDARDIWRELGGRQAYAAQHHRDELRELLGDPGEGGLSDEELIERIRGVLDWLDRGD